jgi:hypothetical protein
LLKIFSASAVLSSSFCPYFDFLLHLLFVSPY